jgi:hypothetical protein
VRASRKGTSLTNQPAINRRHGTPPNKRSSSVGCEPGSGRVAFLLAVVLALAVGFQTIEPLDGGRTEPGGFIDR